MILIPIGQNRANEIVLNDLDITATDSVDIYIKNIITCGCFLIPVELIELCEYSVKLSFEIGCEIPEGIYTGVLRFRESEDIIQSLEIKVY